MRKKSYDRDVLKPLNGKPKVFKLASYDVETETESFYNKFIQGGFIDERGKYKSFLDKDEMIRYMLKNTDKDTRIYATFNRFDFFVLFNHTRDWNKHQTNMRAGLLIHKAYHNLHFYDTLSYTKASVKSMGDMLGIPKLKFNVEKNTSAMSKYRLRRLITYNHRDCLITLRFMQGFQELINNLGGQMGQTIGSTAMDLFRRKYLKEPIHHEFIKDKKFSDETTVKDCIFKAYHGGRTEMFKRGYDEENIYYKYDYNSLYPSVMLNEYPKPSSAIMSESIDGNLNIDTILKYEGVTECEVIVPYMYYPILPTYIDGKLVFPIGRFRDFFTNIELRLAIKNGVKITKIYKTIAYTKTFKPFTDWVKELYTLRLKYSNEGNTIYKEIIKLLLNNLYGKFGMRHLSSLEIFREEERNDDDMTQDGVTFEIGSGYGYRETPKECNQTYIVPIFAVYTTAYGRIKIWKALTKLKGIYCDSVSKDSIINTRTQDMTIEELWNNQDTEIIHSRDKEFREISYHQVLTCDGKNNIFVKPKRIIRHKIKEEIIRVHLTNKEYIECTKNHSLIDKDMKSIPSRDLKVGMKILSCSHIPQYTQANNDKLNKFTVKEFELMGHIMGNGNILKQKDSRKPNYISLSSKYIENILTKVINPIRETYGFNITRKNKTDIIINCSELARKYHDYGISGDSYTKKVPIYLQWERKENILAFLRGYFNSDGSISIRNNNPIIKVDSVNRELLYGVRNLLRICNISHSYNEENKNTSYKGKESRYNMKRINILDRYKFMQEIGFNNGSLDNKQFNLHKDNRDYSIGFKQRKIIRIEKIYYDDYIYDLEIPTTQRFYANNILVHNTDSVFSTIKIQDSQELGELKLEGVTKGLNIFKQKHYSEKDLKTGKIKYKVKGLRLSSDDNEREMQFEDSLNGNDIKQRRIIGLKESMKGKYKINQVVYITKKFDAIDNKRKWIKPYSKDGMRDSQPRIIGFDNLGQLQEYYDNCKSL